MIRNQLKIKVIHDVASFALIGFIINKKKNIPPSRKHTFEMFLYSHANGNIKFSLHHAFHYYFTHKMNEAQLRLIQISHVGMYMC
ncbi:hypothetical protein [Brevibacillus laterosporus]|uniref:hypothetical protein n=1 Tax=Brevibacillus laterosporus TaxID=1465 RepID=UPI00265CB003|nr:hypothetical protein [Brevibacillus laterosporus]